MQSWIDFVQSWLPLVWADFFKSGSLNNYWLSLSVRPANFLSTTHGMPVLGAEFHLGPHPNIDNHFSLRGEKKDIFNCDKMEIKFTSFTFLLLSGSSASGIK